MNLSQLAVEILRLENAPISKVRFAKTIYFVHKKMILEGKAESSDIEYIRMPLGPVPFGFMQLAQNNPAIIVEKVFTGLAYNTSRYSLTKKMLESGTTLSEDSFISSTLKQLNFMTTSELVELSHEDPSWKKYPNGQHYIISPDDLSVEIPYLIRYSGRSTPEEDDQLLQASLVAGMINDIVSESTDLEHPNDGQAST